MLVVVGLPRFTRKPPARARHTFGETMTLNCSAVGDPELVISWRREGGQLPAGRTVVTNGSLTISNLKGEDSGAYACVATSASVSDVVAVTHVQVGGKWALSIRQNGDIFMSKD